MGLVNSLRGARRGINSSILSTGWSRRELGIGALSFMAHYCLFTAEEGGVGTGPQTVTNTATSS